MQDVSERFRHFVARLRTTLKRFHHNQVAVLGLILFVGPAFYIACGGSSGGGGGTPSPPAVPSILNINGATDPSSPVNLAIEINGGGFGSSPGTVVFDQSSSGITATVTPASSDWTNTLVQVTVPSGSGSNHFTVPGTVSVSVTNSGGTSKTITLSLASTLSFNVNNLSWTTTTQLPTALTGLRAVAVPVSSSAFVVVTGGYNGTANTNTVLCNTINPDGTLGPSWTNIPTNILPETIAYHAMVEADSGNSPVPTGSHYIYVIGGQPTYGGTPGGTTNVYMASVNPNSGAVGSWTRLSSFLPVSLVGAAATLMNGYIYLVGGLQADSIPSANVYSAPVNSDGTLGPWTRSLGPYGGGISFATAFGYAGNLYLLGGDNASSVNPGAQGNTGVSTVYFTHPLNGVVGSWTSTQSTVQNRKKQVTWVAAGQVIDAEGVYGGGPATQEVEASQVNSNGTLAPWVGLSFPASYINANVYNAAAIVSPLASAASKPRFLLLGGQDFVTFVPGPLSNQVHYNSAP
jgi:hypothetical protein